MKAPSILNQKQDAAPLSISGFPLRGSRRKGSRLLRAQVRAAQRVRRRCDMRARAQKTLLLLSLAAPLLAGCGRNIVRAASPSVATPPPSPRPATSPTVAAEPIPAPEIPQPAAELAPAPAIEPVPPRPRPAAPAVSEVEAPR